MEHFIPLIKTIDSRLHTSLDFLSFAGKLEIDNSVLASLPTFYLRSIKIYPRIIDQVDKYKMHCLWRGNDISKMNSPLDA